MDDLNILNIPAFKRKRSIAAKAKRTASAIPKITKPKRTSTTRKRTTSRKRASNRLVQEALSDIPIRDEFPSPDFFPEHIEDVEILRQKAADEDLREMKLCGKCDGYFDNIDVAVIALTSALREGDRIIFETGEGLFEQTVASIQIDRKPVKIARSGSDIGLKVLLKPRVGGNVYKVL